MPMNPRLLRPAKKPVGAPSPSASSLLTESGAAITTESGDKIRTEQN